MLFKYIFWIGYLIVLITAFIPVAGELTNKYLGPESFHIRLDHFLHFMVYFMICLYFLTGQIKNFSLFQSKPHLKFTLSVFFLATITEVVQLWVPDRAFNPMDWVSNISGVLLGLLVIKITGKKAAVWGTES